MAPNLRWVLKGFALLALLGVLGIGALVGSLWLEHRTDLTLPTPTGSSAVGRATYDWADDATLDTLAPVPGTKRELLVWIWYPSATGQPAGLLDDYLPVPLRAEVERDLGTLIGTFLTRDLSRVHAHHIRDSAVSPQQRSYPVVLIRAGASAAVWNYSTLAEDLASHGYVVVGFDAPYRTGLVVFPDGRVMRRTPENNPELCADKEQAQQDACMDKLLTAWTSDLAWSTTIDARTPEWSATAPRQVDGGTWPAVVGPAPHGRAPAHNSAMTIPGARRGSMWTALL